LSDLTWVATYERSVAASLERVWENVLDWEHLPSLHARAFGAIECEAAGDWGWRARVALPGAPDDAPRMRIALTLEEPGDRYVVRTLEGAGEGSEIWTRLDALAPHRTAVSVRFGVPGVEDEAAERVGEGYVRLYTQLWDEDEAMMVERERALARLRARDDVDRLDLGPVESLAFPLDVEARGRCFRVEAVEGGWLAYSTTCPHLLGPLAREGGELRCPWHDYRFDPATGRSCDGRGLRLAAAPRVETVEGRLQLRWD